MQSKATIIKSLIESMQEVTSWVINQDDYRFVKGPIGKWDTSQHISHLTKTAKLVTKGLSYPKIILNWKFGKPNRAVRNKNQIISKYQEKLKLLTPGTTNANTAGDSNRNKELVLKDFDKSLHSLVDKIDKSWSETQMDKFLLPHPLMGRMPIRELLIWVDIHQQHHLENLKESY